MLFPLPLLGLPAKGHKVIGGDAAKSRVNGINQRKPPIYAVNLGDILKSLRECCEK